ncbi:MAG: flagellar hook-length control protein FliK [bacterium]|nr:flagellar hook-length control protein FliK [bacterium]
MTERPVVLRIPVKNNTPVISTELPAVEKTVNQGSGHTAENFQIKESQNGDGSSLKNPELTKNTGAQQNSSVFQNNTQSSTTIKGSDETIIADTAEKTFDTKDAKNSILPGQVEITLESEDNAHKTYKTQGVFVSEAPVKDVKNDKQLSSDYSSFRAGDDLNSSDRFMTQKIGEESNQNSQQNAFSSFKEGEKGQKEFNNNKNIELQGEKAVSAEKPFEARLSDAGSPKAEHVVKVWDIEKLANQITKMAKFSVNKEQSEMKIQLEPKHLGKMFMKISVEDHQLNGSVRVETHEAKAMIQDNLPQLRESIADKGVDLQKLDVFVQSDQQHQLDQSPWAESDRFGSQKTGNSNSGPGKDEELSADEMVDTNKIREFGYNTIELVA